MIDPVKLASAEQRAMLCFWIHCLYTDGRIDKPTERWLVDCLRRKRIGEA